MLNRILIVLMVLSFGLIQAQNKKAEKEFLKSIKYHEKGEPGKAIEQLKITLQIDPDHYQARKYLGQYFEKKEKNYSEAYKHYAHIVKKGIKTTADRYMKAGEMAYKAEMYSECIEMFDIMLGKSGLIYSFKQDGTRLRNSAQFIMDAKKNPIPFEPTSLGGAINSEYRDYFPAMTADEETFIITRKLPRGDGSSQEDFYQAHKGEDGNWKKSYNIGAPVNTMGNEGAATISADGKYIFFTKCQEGGMDRSTYGGCDIFVSERLGSKWGAPKNLGPVVNGPAWESQACMSADGKRLYFISKRPGGKGGADVWYSEWKDGKWNIPVNVGDSVNTPGNEYAPFIHPDGMTLYFSSDYHTGMGKGDFFMSRRMLDGKWSNPKNLGYPINSIGNEVELFITSDGEWAYSSTDRWKTPGDFDIYKFKLPEDVKPKPVIYVKGKVTSSKTKRGIGSDIELIDIETDEVHTIATSDAVNGEYLVILPLGKDFALNIDKKGYLFHSENFSLSEAKEDEPYIINVALNPIEVGKRTVMKNVFYETGSYKLKEASFAELNVLHNFLLKNPTLKIEIGGHTDNVGSKSFNQTLSEKRAKSTYDYLIAKGIDPIRLKYKGYADSVPVATNDTPEGRSKNRRTEIKVID